MNSGMPTNMIWGYKNHSDMSKCDVGCKHEFCDVKNAIGVQNTSWKLPCLNVKADHNQLIADQRLGSAAMA